MKKATRTPRRRATGGMSGHQAVAGGHRLQSWTLGALPILDHFLQRMRLEEILQQFLPAEDSRTIVPTARALAILVKQVLLSREPLYAMSDWIAGHDPQALGLRPGQVDAWNDDRAGRALIALFHADRPSLVLALVRHVVREFALRLDELHNDSTTVTFSGLYIDASEEQLRGGRPTPAITWGHNKDHRPDLKQLLYILTVTRDGGVPVGFRVASGNVTDDATHRQTWELLCELAGRRDFLYVADCK
jgi:hypothetical protein